jgi:hypothetical protein
MICFFALAAVETKLPQMSGEAHFGRGVFGFVHGNARATPNKVYTESFGLIPL